MNKMSTVCNWLHWDNSSFRNYNGSDASAGACYFIMDTMILNSSTSYFRWWDSFIRHFFDVSNLPATVLITT